ncbi:MULTISPECIES: STAS domain-containing protein [Calothrix]|uniref:Anti-sigma factor antagonist n=2 Tax=Calothrix TaxID=1186 RepID=A0ABR8AKL4_9CYAN|nr:MULTISPECIES: STAS domain-containing protein [Calothrix]MBD2200070.1 STAS domain-containing protein [Calothrix parietina FACHB-288]MBD2229036.1 STAS domain-containing protein [Calothrix anomala FACHB-343]
MEKQVKVIQPAGIFNGKQGRETYEQMSKLMAAGAKTFLLDFQAVTFMDSSGFGTLLSMLKTVQQEQGRLVLCSINEQIRMILELSNTTTIFEVLPDQAAFMEQLTPA